MIPEDFVNPEYDPDFAARLIGKRVLVGLTRASHEGQVIYQYQLHGVVVSAHPRDGIEIALEGVRAGSTWVMPPATAAFRPGEPGVYRLRETGEEVQSPDFVATWTMTEPSDPTKVE